MRITQKNELMMGWSGVGSPKNIYVARHDGLEWKMIGGSLSGLPGSTTEAFNPSLVFDEFDNSLVAWDEADGAGKSTFVRWWNGTDWQPVGNSLSCDRHNLAMWQHNPIVACTQSGTVRVYQYVGGGWQPVGGQIGGPVPSNIQGSPGLAVNAKGEILTAISEARGADVLVSIRKWSGGAWIEIGSALDGKPALAASTHPHIGVQAERLFVSWIEAGAVYSAFNDNSGAWQVLPSLGPAVTHSIGVGSSDVVVAFQEKYSGGTLQSSGTGVTVVHLNGTTWDTLYRIGYAGLGGNPGSKMENPVLGTGGIGFWSLAWSEPTRDDLTRQLIPATRIKLPNR